jgi:hypothetical protein
LYDRDINAAKNIKPAAGLAVDACGDDDSRQGFAFLLLPVKQEPLVASPPVPGPSGPGVAK